MIDLATTKTKRGILLVVDRTFIGSSHSTATTPSPKPTVFGLVIKAIYSTATGMEL